MTGRIVLVGLLVVAALAGGAVGPSAGTTTDATGASDSATVGPGPASAVTTASADAGTANASGGQPGATASDGGSDRRVAPGGALYLGERNVDVTALAGANPAGESQTFYGVGGEAEGTVATVVDTRHVDVTAANGFVPGGYNLSSSAGDVAVTVRRPRVTDLSLYAGASTSAVDVTNRSVPRGTDVLTAEATFTFDASENVTLTVEDEAGLDVTEQLTGAPTVTDSGGTVTLSVANLSVGRYEVTAEGADDLDGASTTVSFRVRDPEKAVTLSKTRVVSGESTVASVAGAPGDVRYLRLSGSALREGVLLNTATARELFDDTEQVRSVGVDRAANYVYAVVTVDDDGISEVRLRTDRLAADTVAVELAPGIAAPSEDEVTLRVEERSVTVSPPVPASPAIGETVSVSGTAPQSERVKLYAAVDDEYVPLFADAEAGDLAETDVRGDGAWTVDVDTSAVVDLPGSYRVVAVADPGPERLGSTDPVDSETLTDLEPRGSTSLATGTGDLTVAASRTTIAATGSDEFTLSGVAVGATDDLRLYHVGPRGAVTADRLDARDGRFAETIDGLDRRGVHAFVVVDRGRDGRYAYAAGDATAADDLFSGRETQSAALAKIRDAYTAPGSDDSLARVDVTAATPTVSLSSPPGDGTVAPGPVSVSGRSTSEDGSTVVVELARDGTRVASASASVTNGTWNTTLDLSAVDPGSYRLSIDDGEATATRAVVVGPATPSTARPTPTPTDTDPDASNGDGTPTAGRTATVSPDTAVATGSSSATTSTRFPGLGPVAGAGAVVLAALVALVRSRRRRSGR
jgi:hypothetical protein